MTAFESTVIWGPNFGSKVVFTDYDNIHVEDTVADGKIAVGYFDFAVRPYAMWAPKDRAGSSSPVVNLTIPAGHVIFLKACVRPASGPEVCNPQVAVRAR
ncbi:hypothetical protein [Corallococcus sp. AB038B]|uniref:hypothetical protein n=1 Tax=Corallococcus sp. AB038B TaxID=2316718 RepID=UPI0011C3BA95|nr:hypothetical protein [Corallococcus sp. AB038B]